MTVSVGVFDEGGVGVMLAFGVSVGSRVGVVNGAAGIGL
jgi:hypothetical protein